MEQNPAPHGVERSSDACTHKIPIGTLAFGKIAQSAERCINILSLRILTPIILLRHPQACCDRHPEGLALEIMVCCDERIPTWLSDKQIVLTAVYCALCLQQAARYKCATCWQKRLSPFPQVTGERHRVEVRVIHTTTHTSGRERWSVLQDVRGTVGLSYHLHD